MRVLLAGATGAIGRPLVRALIDNGHVVLGLCRSAPAAGVLSDTGAQPVHADVLDRDGLLTAVRGCRADAVVHQATALKSVRATQRRMDGDPTTDLRVRGTAHLLEAAREEGARRFLTQSLVLGYGYRDHGIVPLTERAPFGHPDGLRTDPVLVGLAATENQAFTTQGIEGVALRYGIFYGPGTFSDMFADLLRRRRLAFPPGSGGTACWIHVDDAAQATVAALDNGAAGHAYNLVDDEPVTWRDFLTAVAERHHTRPPMTLPAWVLRAAAPYVAALMLDTSMRVSAAKARRELGWTPAMSTYRDGLRSGVIQ